MSAGMNRTPSMEWADADRAVAATRAGELEATDDRRPDAARAAGHHHALVRELVYPSCRPEWRRCWSKAGEAKS
jgi:hypothetical protein